MVHRFQAASVLLAGLLACTDGANTSPPRPLTYETVDVEVAQLIHQELVRQNIPHEYDGSYALHYAQDNAGRVAATINRVEAQDLPEGRSVGIPSAAKLGAIVEDFKNAGVAYQVKSRSGVDWLTWAEENDQRARELVRRHMTSPRPEDLKADRRR